MAFLGHTHLPFGHINLYAYVRPKAVFFAKNVEKITILRGMFQHICMKIIQMYTMNAIKNAN